MLDKVIKQSPEEMWNEFKSILNRRQFYRYAGIWFYPDFKDQLIEIEYTYRGTLRDCNRYRKSDDKKECVLQAKIDKYVNLLPILQDQLAIYVELLKKPAMLTPDMLTSPFGGDDDGSFSKPKPSKVLAARYEKVKNAYMNALRRAIYGKKYDPDDVAQAASDYRTLATRIMVNIKSMVKFVKDQRRRLEKLISKIQKLNRKLTKELERLHKS